MAYPRNRRQVVVPPLDPTQSPTVLWRCLTCGKAKPESDFTMSNYRDRSRRARCKPCENLRLAPRRKSPVRQTVKAHLEAADVRVTVTVGRAPRRRRLAPAPHPHRFFPLGAAIQRLMQEA